LTLQKPGKGDALRKEKAFLHTFVAGQKYGVGRDATAGFAYYLKQNIKESRLTICFNGFCRDSPCQVKYGVT
jgi:hypothetical protein